MAIDLSWTRTVDTVFAPNVVSLTYVAEWEAAGGTSSGPCGIGLPGFTSGSPWGGVADINMVDFMADPLITGWAAMTLHFQAVGGANLWWDCECAAECIFGSPGIEGTWYDGGGAIERDFQGAPAVFTSFGIGAGFFLGSGNPSYPLQFDPVSFPPPLGSHFVVVNPGGNHITLSFLVFVTVYFPGPVPPPPPPPPPWPTPPPSNPPACGTFIPS